MYKSCQNLYSYNVVLGTTVIITEFVRLITFIVQATLVQLKYNFVYIIINSCCSSQKASATVIDS